MTRQVLYVAHPLRPTEDEIENVRAGAAKPELWTESARTQAALSGNIDGAMRWLSWLRRSFPETTFIAPWIVDILSGADDSDPVQREAGMQGNFAVIERCDGIVLCGPRISSGMRREMEHGVAHHGHVGDPSYPVLQVYDLTSISESARDVGAWAHGATHCSIPFSEWAAFAGVPGGRR